MGATSELRAYLGDDSATVRFEGSTKVITANGKTVEVGPDATNEEIAQALNIQKINSLTKPEQPQMSVTGLEPGSIGARIAAIKQNAATRRAAAMAKLDGADQKLASVDAAIVDYAAQLEKQADDALQEFAPHTNGAPV